MKFIPQVFGTLQLESHPKFIHPYFSHIYYEIRVSQTKQMKNRHRWFHSVILYLYYMFCILLMYLIRVLDCYRGSSTALACSIIDHSTITCRENEEQKTCKNFCVIIDEIIPTISRIRDIIAI
jgi:hypothetical protein